jgi:hypothetical protein
MRVRRLSSAVGAFGIAVAIISSASPGATASAAAHQPRPSWWAKFRTVSAPGFKASRIGPAGTVSVGPNVDVSNENGPQSETSIAIDPTHPSTIVAGSNEIFRLPMRSYHSTDDGASWSGVDVPLPKPLTVNGTRFGSDPGVAWDNFGNVYYSYIVVFFSSAFNHGLGVAIDGTELAVAHSSDGGRTWASTYFGLHQGQGKFNDKPMIAVDDNPSSPYSGRIYVAWDTTNGAGGAPSTTGIKVVHSDDQGRTFSAPVFASDTLGGPRFGFGADPFVAPDGTLHVAWHDFEANAIVEASSTDGGTSFGSARTVAPTTAPFEYSIPAQSSRLVDVYPACDADTSGGPDRGALYCTWNDITSGVGSEVFVSRSTDGGASWSAPQSVADPSAQNADQFFPWLAVDPTNGSVNVSFYDSRLGPSPKWTNMFFTRSTDGGQTWSPNVRITTAPSNEANPSANLGNQYGDYEGIDAFGGEAHPVWTDRRASLPHRLWEEVFSAAVA